MKLLLFFVFPVVMFIAAGSAFKSGTAKDVFVIGPGQMPALTGDSKGDIHLVYGIGDSLLHRTSTNKGQSFNDSRLIAKLPGLNASATRGPQIVATSTGLCVVASTGAGSIYSYVQDANGKWRERVKITDRDSVDLEGFVALAGDDQSSLFAVWLDLRQTGQNKIYGARSSNGGKSWSENMMVYTSPDTTVCQCCKPSVAVSGNHVYVMFRNWLRGKRDLYLIESADKGRTFGIAQKLGNDSWALNGCPMDGGGLVVNKKGQPLTVWNREGTIYSCEPGKPERAVGQGRSCTMTTAGSKNVYAWVENKQVVLLLPDGMKKMLGSGQLPVLKGVGDDHVLCVWENDKQLHSLMVSL